MITAIDPKTALILVDLQKFILNLTPVHPVRQIIDNSNLLLDIFHEKQLPVVLVRVIPGDAAWTKTRKDAVQNRGEISEDLLHLSDSLHVQETDIQVIKHTWSAFFETGLHDILRKKGITGIILGGVSTSIGVEGTARSASELGYNISFATDAISDLSMEAHERSLRYIYPRLGESGTTKEIIEALKKSGTSPNALSLTR